ncbi:DUF6881 domain-containing protein [Streptomyces cellulosae]
MRYLKVAWHHTSPNDPVIIWSEIDADGYEVRKVEQFADGRLGYADSATSTGGTELGEVPIPSVSEIAEQSEFTPEKITANAFEKRWNLAHGRNTRNARIDDRRVVKYSGDGKGRKRSLLIQKQRRGWVVVSAKSRRVLTTARSREDAIAWAKKALASTTSTNTAGGMRKQRGERTRELRGNSRDR